MSPHRAVLTHLVQSQGWRTGAELGVDKGILFHQLLSSCQDLRLIGVDTCPIPHRRVRCEAIAHEYGERASLMVTTTHQASQTILDKSLEFVFIDADHSESAVAEDIQDWAPKVVCGGWLGGHDYNEKFTGVIRAVDQAFGSSVKKMPGSIWGVRVWR